MATILLNEETATQYVVGKMREWDYSDVRIDSVKPETILQGLTNTLIVYHVDGAVGWRDGHVDAFSFDVRLQPSADGDFIYGEW